MPCAAPKGRTVPSCDGYHEDEYLRNNALVLCPYCRKIAAHARASVSAQKKREADRLASIKGVVRQKGVTGASLQKQVTAITEQVIVDLFEDCSRGGNAPTDFALMACGSVARREMVTFSDIDAVLVLGHVDSQVEKYFRDLTLRMFHRLQNVGQRVVTEQGVQHLSNSGFIFCPGGGLTPTRLCSTASGILREVRDMGAYEEHLRGALFPRMIYGSSIVAKNYTDACEAMLKSGAGNSKAAALKALQDLLPRRKTDLIQAKKSDGLINLKTTIYRPTQLIPNEIAVYYGVTAMGTRAQIVALVEGGNMSLEVANVFMETLESYAKVMTAAQLSANSELHTVRTRDFPGNDPNNSSVKLDAGQLASVMSCLPRVELIWRLAEAFLIEKSKQGRFVTKKNPFNSTKPWADMGVQRP